MTVGRVQDQQVHLGFHQRLGAIGEIIRDPQGGAHSEATLIVLARIRVLNLFLNVFDSDEALQMIRLIHDQHLFNPILMQVLLRFLQGGPNRYRYEPIPARRHHVSDGLLQVFLKPEIAIGHNTQQESVVVDHWNSRNAKTTHHFLGLVDLCLRRDGDGVDDHAGL